MNLDDEIARTVNWIKSEFPRDPVSLDGVPGEDILVGSTPNGPDGEPICVLALRVPPEHRARLDDVDGSVVHIFKTPIHALAFAVFLRDHAEQMMRQGT